MDRIKDYVKIVLEKADAELEFAKLGLESNYYNGAISKAYYAAFNAVRAIVIKDNLTFSTHKSVIAHFNRYYVHGGFFPKDYTQKISTLFDARQHSDYDLEKQPTKEEAEESIIAAAEIIQAIKDYLKKDYELT